MNRTLRRVLGLTGSVALGLAGAVTFASAAQAHHPEVTGEAECVDGGWKVTWEVTLVAPDGPQIPDGEITAITPTDPEISGDLQVGATGRDGDVITGVQIFPGDATEAELWVTAEWDYEHGGDWTRDGKVTFNDTCEAEPEPEVPVTNVSHESDCFSLTVTVANNNPEALAAFVLTPSVGEPLPAEPAVGQPFTHEFLVEDPTSAFSVSVTADGEDAGSFDWAGPDDCADVVPAESCDGIHFEVAVPESGKDTTFTVVTSEGVEASTTVSPGGTGTVDVPVEGDQISVEWSYSDGKFSQPGSFEWTKPEDCDEAPPTEEETTPAASEQLPSTGSSMTIMISTAAALVVAAAVLFFIARRRRTASDW